MQTLHCLKLVYGKKLCQFRKYIYFGCSGLEQRSVIKFLVVEKYKPCEVYRRMRDVCKKQALVKILFTNGLATTRLSRRQYIELEHADSSVKKRFQVERSVKTIIRTVFWDMKGTPTIDFLEKGASLNNASYCNLLWQNSPYLLNNRLIYIYDFIFLL